MTPNFLHIDRPYEDAETALAAWLGKKPDIAELYLQPEKNGWITLSIDLDYVPTDDWLKLARCFDFFYESYSTSLCMGEIVFGRDGQLVRHLLVEDENPNEGVDIGLLPCEEKKPLRDWGDIWGFVDDCCWMKNVGKACS